MAFVPQGQQSFGTMTVDENLHVVADRYGSEAKARYDEAVTMFPVLKEFAVERADRYYVLASGRFIATGEGGPAQVEAAKEAMRVKSRSQNSQIQGFFRASIVIPASSESAYCRAFIKEAT